MDSGQFYPLLDYFSVVDRPVAGSFVCATPGKRHKSAKLAGVAGCHFAGATHFRWEAEREPQARVLPRVTSLRGGPLLPWVADRVLDNHQRLDLLWFEIFVDDEALAVSRDVVGKIVG